MTPPPFWTMFKKTADLVTGGTPKSEYAWYLTVKTPSRRLRADIAKRPIKSYKFCSKNFWTWSCELPLTLSFSPGDKGCHPKPNPQFFWTSFKRGGGHFHVQKFWSKFCMILKAFWQHKIDIKRLFKGRNVKILGWICHSFHRFTHYFVKLCRDRRLRAF